MPKAVWVFYVCMYLYAHASHYFIALKNEQSKNRRSNQIEYFFWAPIFHVLCSIDRIEWVFAARWKTINQNKCRMNETDTCWSEYIRKMNISAHYDCQLNWGLIKMLRMCWQSGVKPFYWANWNT